MDTVSEIRKNTHQRMLVDVGVMLHREYGDEYARSFMEEMEIPEGVIARVLTRSGLRPRMPVTQIFADH
jgi:hypothetical protein